MAAASDLGGRPEMLNHGQCPSLRAAQPPLQSTATETELQNLSAWLSWQLLLPCSNSCGHSGLMPRGY